MWTQIDIMAWMQTLGVGVPATVLDGAPAGAYPAGTLPLYPGTAVVPPLPDRVGVVTATGGAGQILEGLADVSGFQLRVRGQQNDPADGERLALTADAAIIGAPYPVTVATVDGGKTRLVSVRRSGGRPAPMGPSPDLGDRSTFTCTYLLTVMEA